MWIIPYILIVFIYSTVMIGVIFGTEILLDYINKKINEWEKKKKENKQ